MKLCPTRIDGRAALFAHKVSEAQCQSRQRGQYHKCFTCAYANAYVAKFGMPEERAAKDLELEVTTEFAAMPRLPEVPAAAEFAEAAVEAPAEAPAAAPAEASAETSTEPFLGPAAAS